MSKLPLEGIRIIDSTYVYAMPYSGGLMADLGAEVIKIEGPSRLDTTRNGAHVGIYPDYDPGKEPWTRGGRFNTFNRGKKSLVLDLSKEEGREVLKDLIKVSDMFMENFTPRVMRNWGLDYPNMKKLKPDIIMVSNTGYGHSEGPYSPYPSYASVAEAVHGLTHVTGYRGDIPSKAGAAYVDFVACWTSLFAIASALRHRKRTGKGQWIDLGMYQLGCMFIGEYILDWMANGRLGGRMGNRHPWRAPQGCYPCSGEDQWCVISVGDDEEWAALCRVMGRPELAQDPRFASGLNRMRNHDEIDEIIKEWTSQTDKFKVMELLQGAGVPAGPVFDSRDTNLDKHLWARGFLAKVQFPKDSGMGKRVLMGRPWYASKMPVSIKGPGPRLGADNRAILMGVLKYTQSRYDELEKAGIIANRPTDPRPMPNPGPQELVKQGNLAYYDPDYKAKLGI